MISYPALDYNEIAYLPLGPLVVALPSWILCSPTFLVFDPCQSTVSQVRSGYITSPSISVSHFEP